MNKIRRQWLKQYSRGTMAATIAGVYALVVLGAAAFVLISTTMLGDNGLTGIFLLFVTLPISIPLHFILEYVYQSVPENVLLDLAPNFGLWAFIAGGLFQAWLLWRLLRGALISRPGQA